MEKFVYYQKYKTANTTASIGKVTCDTSKVVPKYLMYFVLSDIFKNQMWAVSNKTAQPGFNNRDLKKFIIPIPHPEDKKESLKIQENIVDKIDSFYSYINNINNEIISEKLLIENFLKNIMVDKINNLSHFNKYRFKDIATVNGRIGWKGLKKSEYTQEGPILLSVHNLGKYDIDYTETKHISRWRYDESPEIKLKTDDILLTKDGAGIGKLGFVNKLHSDVTVNSSIAVIRSKDKEKLLPKFLYRYFQSTKFQDIVNRKRTGSCVPHLFQKDIKNFELIIPHINEQNRIVKIIDDIENFIKNLENYLDIRNKQLNELPKIILLDAFSGKLN